jgi:hypothetical protein
LFTQRYTIQIAPASRIRKTSFGNSNIPLVYWPPRKRVKKRRRGERTAASSA